MEAFTYKLKTPMITGGRSHIPLADTELMSVGINYYSVGRKNKLHAISVRTIPLSCWTARRRSTIKNISRSVLNKGEAIMLPIGTFFYFENSGDKPLALLRVSALKGKPEFTRVDAEGNKRTAVEDKYITVDGEPIPGQFWQMT